MIIFSSTFSDKSEWCKIFLSRHRVVGEANSSCQSGGSCEDHALRSIHVAYKWNHVGLEESEQAQHDVVDRHLPAYVAKDYLRRQVHKARRVTMDPMRAIQKVHSFLSWNTAKALEEKVR